MQRRSWFIALLVLPWFGLGAATVHAKTYTLRLFGATISPTKANGKKWDLGWGRTKYPDVIAIIEVGGKRLLGTKRKNTLTPQWNISRTVELDGSEQLFIRVIDKDMRSDDLIGSFKQHLSQFPLNKRLNLSFGRVLRFGIRLDEVRPSTPRVARTQPPAPAPAQPAPAKPTPTAKPAPATPPAAERPAPATPPTPARTTPPTPERTTPPAPERTNPPRPETTPPAPARRTPPTPEPTPPRARPASPKPEKALPPDPARPAPAKPPSPTRPAPATPPAVERSAPPTPARTAPPAPERTTPLVPERGTPKPVPTSPPTPAVATPPRGAPAPERVAPKVAVAPQSPALDVCPTALNLDARLKKATWSAVIRDFAHSERRKGTRFQLRDVRVTGLISDKIVNWGSTRTQSFTAFVCYKKTQVRRKRTRERCLVQWIRVVRRQPRGMPWQAWVIASYKTPKKVACRNLVPGFKMPTQHTQTWQAERTYQQNAARAIRERRCPKTHPGHPAAFRQAIKQTLQAHLDQQSRRWKEQYKFLCHGTTGRIRTRRIRRGRVLRQSITAYNGLHRTWRKGLKQGCFLQWVRIQRTSFDGRQWTPWKVTSYKNGKKTDCAKLSAP